MCDSTHGRPPARVPLLMRARYPGPRLLPHTHWWALHQRGNRSGVSCHTLGRTARPGGKLLEGGSKAPQVGGAGRRRLAGQEGWEDQGGSGLISRPGRRWSHPDGGEVSG